MHKINKTIHITAAPKTVMDYITTLRNHPHFILALESVGTPDGDPRVPGTSWSWTFTMGGVHVSGIAHTVSFTENRRFCYQTTGDLQSIFTYAVEPDNGGANLTITVTYEMPHTVLSKVAEKLFITHINEFVAEQAAKNLCDILSE